MIRKMHDVFEGGRQAIDRAYGLVCLGLLAATITVALAVALRLSA